MRPLPVLLSCVPLLGLAQASPVVSTNGFGSVTLELRAGVGVAGYEERVDIEPVDSEWSALAADVRAQLRGGFGDAGLWRFSVQGWQSDADQETWTGQGRLFQVNEMEASGAELRAAVGRAWSLASGVRTEALVHVGARAQEFLRTDFETGEGAFDLGEVSEEYALGFAGASAGFAQDLDARTSLATSLSASWFFLNEASNSLVPVDIEGQGGYLLEASGEIVRRLSARAELVVGVSMELQDLTGDSLSLLEFEPSGRPSFSLVEWPDNTLSRLQGTLAWRVRL